MTFYDEDGKPIHQGGLDSGLITRGRLWADRSIVGLIASSALHAARRPTGFMHSSTETDYVVGELTKALERLGVADNTVVMFSSDSGPEVSTVYQRPYQSVDLKANGGREASLFYTNLY